MKPRLFIRLVVAAVMLLAAAVTEAKVYLVSVGVNDYSHFPGGCNNLSLSLKDARAVAQLYGKNTATEYSLLTDANATRAKIKGAIKQVLGKAGENDIVVFYFSGHGYPGGFCAYDGKLNYSDIRSALSTSRCKNKMMFIDSCHSGAMRQGRGQSNQTAVNQAKKANVMLFLSSRDSEVSRENSQLQNGLFTAYLLKGLKGGADANRDRVITARELYDYVHTKVINKSQDTQHPVMWGKFRNSMPVMQW